MAETVVDRLYRDFNDLVAYLDKAQEISLRSAVDENFRKVLLLAAASYFERQITDELLAFVKEKANGNVPTISFVRNKAISRQYHTFFDWSQTSANQFFSLFGDGFKKYMQERVDTDDQLQRGVKAFLEIGRERNRLVHQDFASFTLEKTANEIYENYQYARVFVEKIPLDLRTWSSTEEIAGESS